MPGAFDRHGQFPLLAGGAMRLPARKNLPALVQTTLESLNVLVINYFVVGENGLLAASTTTSASTATSPNPGDRDMAGKDGHQRRSIRSATAHLERSRSTGSSVRYPYGPKTSPCAHAQ